MGARSKPADYPPGVPYWYPETRPMSEAVRVALRSGATVADLAAKHGVCQQRIRQIAATAKQLDAAGYVFPEHRERTNVEQVDFYTCRCCHRLFVCRPWVVLRNGRVRPALRHERPATCNACRNRTIPDYA